MLLAEGERTYQGGYLACQKLLVRSSDFTALCCFNDDMAIGAMKAIHEAGLSIPEDISLFGFDNIEILDFLAPTISSVSQPTQKFVTHSAKLLLSHLNKTELPDSAGNAFSGELVVRESVRNLNTAIR